MGALKWAALTVAFGVVALIVAGALDAERTPDAMPSTSAMAALGGTVADFTARLGAPNDHSSTLLLNFRRCAGRSVDEYLVSFAPDTGVAYLIQRQSCGSSPSDEQRNAEALGFSPSDAQPGQRFMTKRGEVAQSFVSRQLASRMGQEWFRGCDGSPVVPGTYSVVVTGSGWAMATGACP